MNQFAVLGSIGVPEPTNGLAIWAARKAHSEARRQGGVLVNMIQQARSQIQSRPVIWNPNPGPARVDVTA